MNMFKLALCLLLLFSGGSSRRSKGSRLRLCRHQTLPMEESFFMVPHFHNVTRNIVDSPRRRHTYLSGNRTCPVERGGYSCPWYFSLSYDPDREPSFVVEALCKCVACQNDETSRCVPLRVPRTVLRRRPGFKCMSWSVESFSVGCVCKQHSLLTIRD